MAQGMDDQPGAADGEKSAATETTAERGSRRLSRRQLFGGILAVVGTLVGVVLVSRAQLARDHAQRADDLVGQATSPSESPFSHDDLTGLPAPVQQYFRAVLTEGQPHVETARLTQDGEMRLGDADSAWKPMTATNTVSVTPPGFVWDAEVEMAPSLPVRVLDTYSDGEGYLRAKLLSAVTVAEDGPSPAMDEGELARYLAEAPWYPTALLPASGVEWEPVDDNAARATLTDHGTTVAAVFHFDGQHRIERVVFEDRPRGSDDGPDRARWTGQFREYERHSGMLIPTEGEVAWNLPDGDFTYWRATITDVEYDPPIDG